MSNFRTKYNTRDDNEPELIAVVERMGVHWVEGAPLDGWINVIGWIPVEIKNPDGLNRLRPGQARFIALCQRSGWPYLVLRTVDDAVDAINALRRARKVA